MKGSFTGYIGSDSEPMCTKKVCWYLYNFPYQITQEQLDGIKVEGVESNYRINNVALLKKYNPNMYRTGLF